MTDEYCNTALFHAVEKETEKLIDSGADVNASNIDGYTPLFYAVEKENEKMVDNLIQCGADVNATNKDGYTPLFYAVEKENEKLVEKLIECGADVNATDKVGKNPLFHAVLKENKKLGEKLIQYGADVNATNANDKDGRTPLFYAVGKQNEKIVKKLIQYGADINASNKDGKTVLFYAVQQNYYSLYYKSVVHALIDAGADVNKTDEEGKTALFHAVQKLNSKREVCALVDAGADVNKTDYEGKTTLFYAVQQSNNESAVRALIDAGGDVNITDEEGKTALFYAVQQSNNESVVLALIDAGGDVNITDEEGKTALFHAVQQRNNLSVVRASIDAGADVNITDNDGKTALFHAVQQSKNESAVRALIDAGADVNITDNDGKTALLHAVQQSNNESVVHALIDAGTDVNITDEEGKTALFHAIQQRNNLSVVRTLIDAGADVNLTDNEGKTALFYAVQQSNNESVVHALIDAGGDVNITDEEGKTALFYAVQQSNNESVVHALIDADADATSPRDIYGRTALFYAMTKSQSITCYLLEEKVNVRIKDNCGMSFLSFFVDHCISKPVNSCDESYMKRFISERIDLVVQKGVRRNTVYEAILNMVFCKSPLLFYPVINVPILIFFLELAKTFSTQYESSINNVLEMVRKTVNDKTLCRALVPQILDLLCELGADPNSADTEGNTSLHYATCLPFYGVSKETIMDLLKKLEEAGVTVDKKNGQSETPLLFCLTLHSSDQQLLDESSQLTAIKTLVEVCGFLIKNGSNVEEKTKNGDSVLNLIMKLLQKILEWHGKSTRLKDATQVGIELFILFSSTRAGRRFINEKDENLNSPLHLWASLEPPQQCLKDNADGGSVFSNFMKNVLNKLLDCGIKLNERNKHGQAPLHLCRTWAAVELLLDSGANPNVVDSSGRSPLIVAAKRKTLLKARNTKLYPDVEFDAKAFWNTALEKGLDPWIVDEDGNSVLSSLIELEAQDLAKAMIDIAHIDGFLKREDISNSLLCAVCKNSSDSYWKCTLVKTIVKSDNLVNIKTSLALNFCCRNIIEASKTLSVDEVQMTVHWTIAKQLLSCGANCYFLDSNGQSCLDIAEAFPALKELLSRPIDMNEFQLVIPWSPMSKMHQTKLEKVARHLESEHVKSYWYHKDHLARGSFGAVFAGIHEKDGREVAIKRIEKIRMQRPEDKREITNLTALADCEQIVRYLFFFEDEHFSYIVLELMEGNLDQFLNTAMKMENKVSLCQDIVQGLKFLHGQGILHRDLKPTNILYKTHPKLCLKIADFGLSRRMDNTGSSTSVYGSNVGTRCWIAPEVLTSQKPNSKSSDVFACGLILHYILAAKTHPFAPRIGALQHEIESNIQNGKMEGLDDFLCPEVTHLVKAMLDGNESKRPSANKALHHPFFWSKKKKLELLIAVGNQPEFEYPRARRTLPLTAVETDLEITFGTIVKYVNWDDPEYVHMPAIYTGMTGRRKRYDIHSVVELVRFIRNAYAYVTALPKSIQDQLLENFVFLEYFPNLVMEVYKAVTTHGWDQTREEIKYAINE